MRILPPPPPEPLEYVIPRQDTHLTEGEALASDQLGREDWLALYRHLRRGETPAAETIRPPRRRS